MLFDKIIKLLRKATLRSAILSEFNSFTYTVRIEDSYSIFCPQRKIRSMNGCGGQHSAIYVDAKHKTQPIYTFVQEIIKQWSTMFDLNSIIVLGCAGCTIPRYIMLSYPKCNVVGVELCANMISAAKEYFLSDLDCQNLQLINEDVFVFLKNHMQTYNVCYVDLFFESNINGGIYIDSFWEDIVKITTSDSLVILNCYGQKDISKHKLLDVAKYHFNLIGESIDRDDGYMFFIKASNNKRVIASKLSSLKIKWL